MIHIFKHRKGQTYEQIKLAKNKLFLFTCFNPLSPNSDQHQFSSDSQYPYKVKRLGFSGALAREARSGAPWVTKCGKLPIRENLVIT